MRCRLGWHKWDWVILPEDEWMKELPNAEFPLSRVCVRCKHKPAGQRLNKDLNYRDWLRVRHPELHAQLDVLRPDYRMPKNP